MPMSCDHMSLVDGTCNLAWAVEDDEGNITEWDTENYRCDQEGYCMAEGDTFPGDACSGYQPDLAGEYCERCGEYLGYEDDEGEYSEESECICNE